MRHDGWADARRRTRQSLVLFTAGNRQQGVSLLFFYFYSLSCRTTHSLTCIKTLAITNSPLSPPPTHTLTHACSHTLTDTLLNVCGWSNNEEKEQSEAREFVVVVRMSVVS